MIIYILLYGVPPFWDEMEVGVYQQILHGQLNLESEPQSSISESAKDLIRGMLDSNVTKRVTAHAVSNHSWIQSDGVAPDRPLDSAVQSRLKQFAAMNKIKNIAIGGQNGLCRDVLTVQGKNGIVQGCFDRARAKWDVQGPNGTV